VLKRSITKSHARKLTAVDRCSLWLLDELACGLPHVGLQAVSLPCPASFLALAQNQVNA